MVLGVQAGPAIADVLFGDANPSGKITASFPRNVGQLPIHYNHKNTGRPQESDDAGYVRFKSNYIDVVNAPLYPFGFGLSYTTYEYGEITLSSKTIPINGKLTAKINIKIQEREAVRRLFNYIFAMYIAQPPDL